MPQETMNVAVGHPTRDLSPGLRHHLWSQQILPEMLLLSDPSRYMWLLECERHLRCMAVQAAYRQHQDPKHPGQLAKCERCMCSYRHGPAAVAWGETQELLGAGGHGYS
jgi:hypothetical protein